LEKAVEIFHSEEKDSFQDTARLAGTEEDEEDALHPGALYWLHCTPL